MMKKREKRQIKRSIAHFDDCDDDRDDALSSVVVVAIGVK